MLSVHHDIPRKGKISYDVTKAGLAMLTKELALALVDSDIKVLGVSYGACDTKMNQDWIKNEQEVEKVLEKIPLKWIAKPQEIAKFVIHILEDISDYATGTIYTIDGGRSLVG